MVFWLEEVCDLLDKEQIILPTGKEPVGSLVFLRAKENLPDHLKTNSLLGNLGYLQKILLAQKISEMTGAYYHLPPAQKALDEFYSNRYLESLLKKGQWFHTNELFIHPKHSLENWIIPKPVVTVKEYEDEIKLYYGGYAVKAKRHRDVLRTLTKNKLIKVPDKEFYKKFYNHEILNEQDGMFVLGPYWAHMVEQFTFQDHNIDWCSNSIVVLMKASNRLNPDCLKLDKSQIFGKCTIRNASKQTRQSELEDWT